MSEPVPPYAGHTALCAAFEQGAGLAAENAQLYRLVGQLLQGPPRQLLAALYDLAHGYAEGWVTATVLRSLRWLLLTPSQIGSAGVSLYEWGLVERMIAYDGEAYCLTPFGARVARALGEG